MKIQPFGFYIVALVGGILTQNMFHFSRWTLVASLLLVISVLVFSFFKGLKKIFVLSSLVSVFFMGNMVFKLHELPKNNDEFSYKETWAKVKIEKFLKPSGKYQKYAGKILNITESKINYQKVLLYTPKDKQLLFPGQSVLLKGSLQPIPQAYNPHQFDYRAYMKHKEIAWQIFSKEIKVVDERLSISGWFWKQKIQIKKRLKENKFSSISQLFIASLGLGDRTDFSGELIQKLSFAGVIHLFAISGLHVGIVFGLMMFLGIPFLKFHNGRNLRLIFSLLMIWLYAWFIGFSPSVTRAALMLTIYYTTFLLQRPTNIYHTLYLSAFILLLIQPHQLFDVGFLLSFSAVFFIIYLNPIRERFKMKIPKHWRKIYDVAMVSLFAQIGVMPVVLYYFGNFSFLFLFANVILILLAGALVILSLLMVSWVMIADLPQFLVKFVNSGADLIQRGIYFFAQQDDFIIQNISWNFIQIVAWFISLILIKKIIEKFSFNYILALLACIFLFESARWVETYQATRKEELIIFHQYKNSILGWRDGRKLNIFYNGKKTQKLKDYILKPYMRGEKINTLRIFDFHDNFTQGKFHKVGNKIKVGNTQITLAPRYPKISFMIEHNKKIFRVMDGMFFLNQIEKIEKNTPIYSTQVKGALVLRNF